MPNKALNMRSEQREGGEEGEGAVEGAVCRRRSQLSAQKGEVVLNFICVVTLHSPSPSLAHTHTLSAHHYLRVCACVCVLAVVTGRWRGAQRVKRTLKPEIGSYSAWLFACLPLSLSLPLYPLLRSLALPCFSSSLVLLLLLRHLLMSTCYCST